MSSYLKTALLLYLFLRAPCINADTSKTIKIVKTSNVFNHGIHQSKESLNSAVLFAKITNLIFNECIIHELVQLKTVTVCIFYLSFNLVYFAGSSYLFKEYNSVHSSSAVELYYQFNLQSTHENVLLELFCQIISEPCFNVLRTQEQLGILGS